MARALEFADSGLEAEVGGRRRGRVVTRFSPTSASSPRRVDLQLIAESIPQIVWMAASDGSAEYFNRRGFEYTGVAIGATGSWDWFALVHPADAKRARRAWDEARRTESLFEVECRIRRADGAFRWHAVRSLPVRGDDGDVVRWIGTATDVHDQKGLEDRLRRFERDSATLESLHAAAPVGFGCLDRKFRWLRVNPALAAINGTTPDNHAGRAAAELMPTLWPQLEAHARQVLSGRPELDVRVTAPARAWLASCYPVRVDGELVGVGLVMVDVTEQSREADEFRSVVMATMAEGLFTADGQGRFTFLNAAAERMLGWTERELRDKPVHSTIHFQHPDGSPRTAAEHELLEVHAKGRAVRVADDAFTRRDGSIFPVAYSATPVAGDSEPNGLVVVFRDTSEEQAEHQHVKRELDALTWVGRTRDALDEDRLVLYSQPIVPLGGGEPSQELLLRMIGRDGEIIRPGIFLPAAEKYGLIGEIDQRVVTQAARVAARGRRVQANLSALSISSLDLLPLIERALSDAGAEPSNLVFEITETALMEDVEAGEAFARGVAEIGCDLALDDFGTGYGSFTRLKRLPIKYLKIDIEFVRDLASSSGNRHVVQAIIGLAKGFGQQTIAEGVEDQETLGLLGDCGVDFAQGYHLGRPAPVAANEAPAPRAAGGGTEAA